MFFRAEIVYRKVSFVAGHRLKLLTLSQVHAAHACTSCGRYAECAYFWKVIPERTQLFAAWVPAEGGVYNTRCVLCIILLMYTASKYGNQ